MTVETGKLLCVTEGSRKKRRTVIKLECQNVKRTKTVKIDVKDEWLAQTLEDKQKQSLQNLDGLEVEFERNENNDPYKIWEVGQQWDRQEVKAVAPVAEKSQPKKKVKRSHGEDFHNPYNFVPALPRDGLPKFDPKNPKRELNDAPPVGHGRYLPEYWSGRISLKLTTKTPLLIPDAAEMTNANDHKTFPVRLGADGKPYLPATSLKGMLRSAYEAITNSRLGVFEKHDALLAYRIPIEDANEVVPARVEQSSSGELRLCLLPESVKLPLHKAKRHKHGDYVQVQTANHKVTNIKTLASGNNPQSGWKAGWAHITGRNTSSKKNERVFIQNSVCHVEIDDRLKSLWENLIRDYQEVHKKDLADRKKNGQSPSDYLGSDPGKTAWSLHIYDPDQLELKDGILCYVELEPDCDPKKPNSITPEDIVALQPVTGSRRLYNKKPINLLSELLQPAVDFKELSPADRVFGWVKQGKRKSRQKKSTANAYKGQLRVHSIECLTPFEKAVNNDLGELGVPLAILGEPKPAQTRFYTAEDKKGTPIANDGKEPQEKKYGYESEARGLRGRKVYPHHSSLPDGYWDSSTEDTRKEYRRYSTDKVRDSQNKSIKSWVNPGTEFSFDLDVINLSGVELGALLWLLNQPENAFHRLGGGKPLGFGSVRLEIAETDLRNGEDWQEFYGSLRPVEPSEFDKAELISAYTGAVESAYQISFENVPFIAAFRRSLTGFEDGLPTHYPRREKGINSDGKNYEWFTDNEAGDRLSLPSLADGGGLPLNPRTEAKETEAAAWKRPKATNKRLRN